MTWCGPVPLAPERIIVGFELSVSGRNDGTLQAAYFRFKNGKVKKTMEVIEDTLLADYDKDGELLGIEVLAPVHLKVLANQVEQPRRNSFRKFVRRSAPAALVYA
jgi:uncharacterized protein YuzE